MTTSNQTPTTTQINRDELIQLLGDSQDSITCKVEQIELLHAVKTATKAYTQTHSHDTQTIKHLHTIDEILTMDFTTDSGAVLERIDSTRKALITRMPAMRASEIQTPTTQHINKVSDSIDGISSVYDCLTDIGVVLSIMAKAKDLNMVNSLAQQMLYECEQGSDYLEQYLTCLQAEYKATRATAKGGNA